MTNEWIFGWWNVVFLAPFAVAMVYLFVYALTGVTFGDADHDTDVGGHDVEADAEVEHDVDVDADAEVEADVDADVDADAEAELDADAEVDADVDHDFDADGEVEHDVHADAAGHGGGDGGGAGGAEGAGGAQSSVFAAMTWLGIGRVPLSIVLLVLLLSWGVIGFCSNQVLRTRVADPARIGFLSMAVALVGSALVTRGATRVVARVLPDGETYAVRRHELLGAVGRAVSPIDAHFGLVAVHDEHGHLFQVPARTRGDGIEIPKGAGVRLVAYTAKSRTFHVIEHDAAAPATPPPPPPAADAGRAVAGRG